MRKIFKKINIRKSLLILFAISTAMPFFSVIGTNLTTKLSDIFNVEAADVINILDNLPDPAGYVTVPSDPATMYYDGANKNVYSKPIKDASGNYTVSVVINLNKPCGRSIEAYYHLENYTAIMDKDFVVPKDLKAVIPAGGTSVTVSFKVNSTTFGVKGKNSNFAITRAFRFVLDKLVDANGKNYEIYDVIKNGYKEVSGQRFKNDALCMCANSYSYDVMDQYEGEFKNSGLKAFTDYYDYLDQEYGVGEGHLKENTYDIGGSYQTGPNVSIGKYEHQIDIFSLDEQKIIGRQYKTGLSKLTGWGSIRACPSKTNKYYDAATDSYAPYKDWLNRIVKTNLGHSYGSFNAFHNGWDYATSNYIQSFFLGDYSFVTKNKTTFGNWTLFNYNNDNDSSIDRNHYLFGMDFKLNVDNKPNWMVSEVDLEKYKYYLEDYTYGSKQWNVPKDDNILANYTWTPNNAYQRSDYAKYMYVVDYGKRVTVDYINDNNKICWFRLPYNEDEETFGMNLYHQHLDTWYSSLDEKIIKGQTFFGVLDDTEPVLSEPVAIETGSIETTEKIRMSVRFSEPVQNFEHSYFTATVGSGVDLEFRPVKGQIPGCDTVVYETDISSLKDILVTELQINSSIRYDIPSGVDSKFYKIRDYGQTGGHELITTDKEGFLVNNKFTVNINKKDPVINPTPGDISTAPKQSVSAKVNVGYVSQGKVYYSFVKDEGQTTVVPVFSNEEISNDKFYSNVKEISGSGTNITIDLELPQSPLRTGNFYCFAKVVTNFNVSKCYPIGADNGVPLTSGIGPFKIDNTAPVIKIIKDNAIFNSNERKFNIEVTENCDIDKVTVKLNKTKGYLSDQINSFDVSLSETEPNSHKFTGSFFLTLGGILDKYYSIKETGKHVFIPDLEYEDFSLSFQAVDKAGNQTNKFIWDDEERTSPIVLPFSAHESLPVKIVDISQSSVISDIPNVNLYPIGTSITFGTDFDPSAVGKLEASVVKLPTENSNREFHGTYNDDLSGINISQGSPAEDNKSIVTLNKPGNYEIIIRNVEGNYSDSFKFYVTDGLKERTTNYINAMESYDLVPKNTAWQLNETSRLYYLDIDARFRSTAYNGITNPLFSSVNAAKNYIRTHEYEDMYLIKLDMHTASMLNSSGGVSGYTKASKESTVAREGQWWVRYKNSNWSFESTTSTSWGYYFYCESTPGTVSIDIDTISKNRVLANQIESVTETLANNGSTIYLVDDDHIDYKTGAPMLTAGQLEVTKEFMITVTLSGSSVNSIVCKADSEMFANYVTVDNGTSYNSYRLATNLRLSIDDDTTLYASLGVGETHYFRLDCKDGTTLKEALSMAGNASSGIYKILEISSEGANLFEVYVDNDSPTLEIERTVYDPISKDTTVVKSEIDGRLNVDFYSKTFQINGFPQTQSYVEADDYAYVAIFKNGKLVDFAYLYNMTPIVLADGIYDVVLGDRSGNRYTFRTFVSGSDIEVNFKTNVDNSKLTIQVTNREESELLKFDVYCDNELLSSDLSNPKVYTISGSYYAVVQDQYGNKLTTEPFTFTKIMPEIGLFYIEGGLPYPYRENEENPHIIKTVGEDSISLKTCSMLRITYNPETTQVIINDCPSDYYKINAESGEITFNTPCSFSFNVFYKENEKEFVKYVVTYDDSEPVIYGEYYSLAYELLDLNVSNFDQSTNTPNILDYVVLKNAGTGAEITKTSVISYGSVINSTYLYFKISDNSKVKSVVVLRNGVEVKPNFLDQGFNGLEFTLEAIPGNYTIIAYDIFNKSTSLVFTVDDSEFTTATIDGNAVKPVGPLTDEGHQVLYGNSNAKIVCDSGSIITIRYEDENGVYAIKLVCIPSGSTYTTYLYCDSDEGPGITDEYNQIEITEFPFYPFEGINLSISMDNNGVITVDYVAGSQKSKLDVRVSRKDECYNLFNMEFCKVIQEPVFTDGGEVLDIVDHYIYGSHEAKLNDPSGDLTSIMIAYNPLEESFSDESFVPYTADYKFENGFYCYVITNKYGISDRYVAVISDNLSVTIIETFYDKDSESYSINYSDTYSSNKTITVIAYNVKEINEDHGYGTITVEDAKTTVVFTQPGTYYLNITDKNNNHAHLTLIINSEGIAYNEDWMYGYNENALLKDQGYTNQTLSINLTEESLNLNGITQIFYIYNGERYVLYGYNGNNINIPYDAETFKNVIGSLGDGVYRVYFSNKYGDVCVKEIHYQVAPTLSIERVTTMSMDPESVSVENALAEGVWSNSKIKLSTQLNEGQYEFYVKTVDGEYEKQTINYLFELTGASATGEIHYMVKYIDAYGNIHEFAINLVRRQLSFNLNNIKTIEYDNSLYTRENFFFNFDEEDVNVAYKLNGGSSTNYNSGEIVFKDGFYEFIMFDKSGNQTSFVVTKDSIVTFRVIVDGEDKNIYYGAAFNGSTMSIISTEGENVELVSAKLNGTKLNDVKDLQFNKTGYYEILLKDKIGNVRYFCFYMITHEVNSFEYTTQKDYYIYAAFYTNAGGIKVTCMDKVSLDQTHIDLTNAAEGTYEIQIKNKYDNSIMVINVVIDKTMPRAVLNGCNDGDVTTEDISLSKLNEGDIVTVYKDGKVVQQVEITVANNIETITEGGKYRIVVKSKSGNSIEYNFEKLTIANGALSALIIAGLFIVSVSFFAVLLLRNRSKNDD